MRKIRSVGMVKRRQPERKGPREQGDDAPVGFFAIGVRMQVFMRRCDGDWRALAAPAPGPARDFA
jgi:hypothetical protein